MLRPYYADPYDVEAIPRGSPTHRHNNVMQGYQLNLQKKSGVYSKHETDLERRHRLVQEQQAGERRQIEIDKARFRGEEPLSSLARPVSGSAFGHILQPRRSPSLDATGGAAMNLDTRSSRPWNDNKSPLRYVSADTVHGSSRRHSNEAFGRANGQASWGESIHRSSVEHSSRHRGNSPRGRHSSPKREELTQGRYSSPRPSASAARAYSVGSVLSPSQERSRSSTSARHASRETEYSYEYEPEPRAQFSEFKNLSASTGSVNPDTATRPVMDLFPAAPQDVNADNLKKHSYSRTLISHYTRAKHAVPSQDDVFDSAFASNLLESVEREAARKKEAILERTSTLNLGKTPTPLDTSVSGVSPTQRQGRPPRPQASADSVMGSTRASPSRAYSMDELRSTNSVVHRTPHGASAGKMSHVSEERSTDLSDVQQVKEAIRRMEAARDADKRSLEELKAMVQGLESSAGRRSRSPRSSPRPGHERQSTGSVLTSSSRQRAMSQDEVAQALAKKMMLETRRKVQGEIAASVAVSDERVRHLMVQARTAEVIMQEDSRIAEREGQMQANLAAEGEQVRLRHLAEDEAERREMDRIKRAVAAAMGAVGGPKSPQASNDENITLRLLRAAREAEQKAEDALRLKAEVDEATAYYSPIGVQSAMTTLKATSPPKAEGESVGVLRTHTEDVTHAAVGAATERVQKHNAERRAQELLAQRQAEAAAAAAARDAELAAQEEARDMTRRAAAAASELQRLATGEQVAGTFEGARLRGAVLPENVHKPVASSSKPSSPQATTSTPSGPSSSLPAHHGEDGTSVTLEPHPTSIEAVPLETSPTQEKAVENKRSEASLRVPEPVEHVEAPSAVSSPLTNTNTSASSSPAAHTSVSSPPVALVGVKESSPLISPLSPANPASPSTPLPTISPIAAPVEEKVSKEAEPASAENVATPAASLKDSVDAKTAPSTPPLPPAVAAARAALAARRQASAQRLAAVSAQFEAAQAQLAHSLGSPPSEGLGGTNSVAVNSAEVQSATTNSEVVSSSSSDLKISVNPNTGVEDSEDNETGASSPVQDVPSALNQPSLEAQVVPDASASASENFLDGNESHAPREDDEEDSTAQRSKDTARKDAKEAQLAEAAQARRAAEDRAAAAAHAAREAQRLIEDDIAREAAAEAAALTSAQAAAACAAADNARWMAEADVTAAHRAEVEAAEAAEQSRLAADALRASADAAVSAAAAVAGWADDGTAFAEEEEEEEEEEEYDVGSDSDDECGGGVSVGAESLQGSVASTVNDLEYEFRRVDRMTAAAQRLAPHPPSPDTVLEAAQARADRRAVLEAAAEEEARAHSAARATATAASHHLSQEVQQQQHEAAREAEVLAEWVRAEQLAEEANLEAAAAAERRVAAEREAAQREEERLAVLRAAAEASALLEAQRAAEIAATLEARSSEHLSQEMNGPAAATDDAAAAAAAPVPSHSVADDASLLSSPEKEPSSWQVNFDVSLFDQTMAEFNSKAQDKFVRATAASLDVAAQQVR